MIEQQFGIEFWPMGTGTPDADKLKYRHDVRVELHRILCSRAGRALAASLRYQLSAAGSEPESKRGTAIIMAPYPHDDCDAQEVGTSVKSDMSWVLYTPAARGSACFSKDPGSLPHEKLFHELFHALRRVSGHMHRAVLTKGKYGEYTNSEEFVAIVVTNIFISDRTNPYKSGLRENHITHSSLEVELADSFGFFSLGTKAFNMLANFCDNNRGFTQMLAHVPAQFNPVAALYRNRRKAFETAANGDANSVFDRNWQYYRAPGSAAWTKVNPYPGPPVRRP